MPKISVGNKKHGYGVDIDTVFWRRHDLVNEQNIKESKDEEIIEALLATVLLNDFKKRKDTLDALYEPGSELNLEVEARLAEIGKDNLEDQFKNVFDTIDMIFDSVDSDFSSFLFVSKKTRNKDECFKVVFLAIYRLLSEGRVIINYEDAAYALKNASDLFNNVTTAYKTNSKNITTLTKNMCSILKNAFTIDRGWHSNEITEEIDRRLCYSKIELQMTEFKIGLSTFSSNNINKNVVKGIAKTLVAMSNTTNARDAEGLIIVGVADSRKSYQNWHEQYKEQAIIVNQHYIPCITMEAIKLYNSVDNYYRTLRAMLNEEDISPKLKEYVLQNFEIITYHGVELLILRSRNMGEVSTYNGIKYVRHSNESVRV